MANGISGNPRFMINTEKGSFPFRGFQHFLFHRKKLLIHFNKFMCPLFACNIYYSLKDFPPQSCGWEIEMKEINPFWEMREVIPFSMNIGQVELREYFYIKLRDFHYPGTLKSHLASTCSLWNVFAKSM